ncbi:MAG: hypothetical protein ACI9UU_003894, partial [Candidatus Azotimanducaceae bacterium]
VAATVFAIATKVIAQCTTRLRAMTLTGVWAHRHKSITALQLSLLV